MRPLSLVVLDIDHFKRVNDTYGHAIGDVVLKHVADAVMAGMRNADTVCRIGGEEIVIIMPRIDPAQAAEMADALRAAVGAMAVSVGDGRSVAATVSLGFATRQPEEGGESLFRRARRRALRGQARRSGPGDPRGLTLGRQPPRRKKAALARRPEV
ncbi:diguanylate cyclase (GGDEF) domain-containing protein [Methylobacterium sp. 174MFSha1.1]|uniref:GGDEF domain-containing protein n=1 Tax=Methylobacterium sp. 174MFSha1.1 TaxID=1502749 RepID=UPI0008F32F94|nr:GGDEF domain-containing protein [Methylobacterium sp. 174MFSha1.1]SFV06349.1 diguanylate cyclase (GGDEF) domain-containing protein [Methylobacterium sp. 174MFSha1.1]